MTVTPIPRMFDEAATRDFYLGFLGCDLDWEHRFESGLPLTMSVVLGEARLHLGQHHGDCCPGGHVRIARLDLEAFGQALAGKSYGFSRSGPPERSPGASSS